MSLKLNKKNENEVMNNILAEKKYQSVETYFKEKKETKTSFYIDSELLKKVKKHCLNNDISLKDYFSDLVKNDTRL